MSWTYFLVLFHGNYKVGVEKHFMIQHPNHIRKSVGFRFSCVSPDFRWFRNAYSIGCSYWWRCVKNIFDLISIRTKSIFHMSTFNINNSTLENSLSLFSKMFWNIWSKQHQNSLSDLKKIILSPLVITILRLKSYRKPGDWSGKMSV